VQVGDTVNLVRKITGELLKVELTKVLVNGTRPCVEVEWRGKLGVGRSVYKLDLEKDEVLAIDSTPHHRQQMRRWYTIDEAQRKELTELFWSERKRRK
jgi:hypothetical protein